MRAHVSSRGRRPTTDFVHPQNRHREWPTEYDDRVRPGSAGRECGRLHIERPIDGKSFNVSAVARGVRTQSRESPVEDDTVTITRSDGWYVATDEETGVASQGETKAEALANLAEALELHERHVPEDSDEVPDPSDAPWFE